MQKRRVNPFHGMITIFLDIAASIKKTIFSKIKVMMPNNKLKMLLNGFNLLITLFEFGYIPLKGTFNVGVNQYENFRFPFLLILFIDILINFNTGHFNRGTLILNRKEILYNYLHYDFWLEFLSLLPSTVTYMIPKTIIDQILADSPDIMNFLEFMFLLRMIYIDKMIRRIIDFYQSTEYLNNFISLLKLGNFTYKIIIKF